MKKQQLVAAIAALSALCITGCNNEVLEDGAPQAGKQVMMTLQGTTDAPQTRADYTADGENMNFSWRSGDELSVVVDNETANNNCKLTTTTEGKSAPFSGTVTTFADTKTIYAFYPYSATPYVVTGGDNKETATAILTLSNPQKYTIGGAISNSFMVGVGSATDAITASASLKQVMSIIKLNITNAPAKVIGVKLTCTDAIFATTATVKLSDATITNSGTLVKELSMTVTDTTTTDHAVAKAISFAIFPKAKVDGKKIQIVVTYEGGKSKMIEKDDIAFERNVHYTMEFDGTPVAPSITWAVGNLVADELGGAKIGTATDGGLYFQFGSLVGWSGGVTGDGTGRGNTDLALSIVVKPATFTGNENWKDTGKIWQGTTGTVPFTVKDSGSNDEKAGIGDPCRYYLGDPWRLPTTDEYKALFEDQTEFSSTSSPWKWDDTSKSATYTDGLTFPASGYRANGSGKLNKVGTNGHYWSASPFDASFGYYFYFYSSFVNPINTYYRAGGFSVRCVQTVSN